MAESVVVTIGRNINTEPMSDDCWLKFKLDVLWVVNGATVVLDTDYDGSWEGRPETAHATYAIWESDTPDKDTLTRWLRELAREYGQDAIGVAWGDSELVEPS